mgnify:CR=1 FL=1
MFWLILVNNTTKNFKIYKKEFKLNTLINHCISRLFLAHDPSVNRYFSVIGYADLIYSCFFAIFYLDNKDLEALKGFFGVLIKYFYDKCEFCSYISFFYSYLNFYLKRVFNFCILDWISLNFLSIYWNFLSF